jgi:signal peptidase II
LALLLTTIGCDRVTKHIAGANIAGQPGRSYLAGALRLEYAENTGAFMSMGSRLPEWARFGLFKVTVGVALAWLAVVALSRWTGAALAGASLVFAGGVSNLLDRMIRGSVVDFLSVGWGPLRTGIFNVADVAILLGGVLIVLSRSKRPA